MKHRTAWKVAALGSVLLLHTALAQEDVDRSRKNAITEAIERAAPAVVTVNVIVERSRAPRRGDMFDFFDFFYSPEPIMRRVESVGSGFVFDPRGYILTNYHVFEGANVKSVTLSDGREIEVEITGVDTRTDIAVLRAKTADLPYLRLGDSDDMLTGEWAIAIGNPFNGFIKDPQPTVSVGVISANHRRLSPNIGHGERLYQDMVQTDAAINPGNSGGPLVNARGEAIGVNTMIFSKGGGSEGLGFAIPINRARRVADEIIRFGRRRDPWPGFQVQDLHEVSDLFLQQQGIESRDGCIVLTILRDSPAYAAGLRPGDIILAINDEAVNTTNDLDFAIWGRFVGDTIVLKINRKGQDATLRFEAEELSRDTEF
ncbi:MAG: trypsin-like peptidase domain-containing protein [Candidatus Hydrogenedentes bacterium]|nr:trypsin-like peptidase domain-containing protein [Candidatus Hydrogenedentota bacterium]